MPELAGFRGATADSPLITVRHLLTMSSGLPTDDPWGDRLQGLPLDAFAELLGGGFTFAWPPGTAFEYSNLGYGILGRVLTNVSGQEYRDLIRDRLLIPLGMGATVYEADQVPDARLAQGHVHRDAAFVDEPFDRYGALASMGGVFSSVRDLTTWVHGFAEAFPARDDPEGSHPLSRGLTTRDAAGAARLRSRTRMDVGRELRPRCWPAATGSGCSSPRTSRWDAWWTTAVAIRGSARTCAGIPRRASA